MCLEELYGLESGRHNGSLPVVLNCGIIDLKGKIDDGYLFGKSSR